MSLATRALWTIDRNLRRDLTLGSVAEAVGVSRYHLAHAFGASTGMSVMEYARARRLSEAAGSLANGASSILDLALEYGYASHEAFSRAFKAQFGTTPEAVRRDATTMALPLVQPAKVPDGAPMALNMVRSEKTGELCFVGMSEPVGFNDNHVIPAMWGRFMPRYGEIEERADPIPWGISTNVDDDGNFDYVCAVKVKRIAAVPKGMIGVRLPTLTYSVFLHEAHISEIPRTFAAIWNDWQPPQGMRIADGASLERHLPGFDTNTGYGGVEIWIPLEQGATR
jgi:AraC family transcriptional regulator